MRSRIEKVLIDESEEAYGTTTEQTGSGRPGATYEAGKLWQAAVAPVGTGRNMAGDRDTRKHDCRVCFDFCVYSKPLWQ